MTRRRAPLSTYRLQIRAEFTLEDAEAILDYVDALGADWVYLSPLLAAVPGSSHGYNTIDHSRIDPERGGEAGFLSFTEAAHARGLGVLLDIVPNHVGVERPEVNPWWWSVLRDGQASPYAAYFDIDWEYGCGKLRIPVLSEESVDAAAASGALQVVGDELRYGEHRYPLAEGTAGADADAATIHAQQHYELIHWSRADHELNYRRFFAVNELAAVRVELPQVFDDSHDLILRAVADGRVDGLRVDHPDGLIDPEGYLETLRARTSGTYVLIEKILEHGVDEALPSTWPIDGTTGYDAMALTDRVLIDPEGVRQLADLDDRLRNNETPANWHDLALDAKRMIADTILGSEVARLVRDYRHDLSLVGRIDRADDAALTDAMAELLTCFPVYRSYLPYGRERLDSGAAEARTRRPDLAETITRIHALLADPAHAVSRRFQQTSGMVMAKGVEDTAFYRTSVLASLTEVGAEPSIHSIDVADYHAHQVQHLHTLPLSMTAASTHDTKRGEDTRARIDALSEVPAEWQAFLGRRRAHADLGDGPFENLLWQSIVGAWPREREALHAYAEKAAREAAVSTTWHAPNAAFEARMHALIDSLYDDAAVVADLEGIVDAVAAAGRSNGLSAKLLQLSAPGVPDVYQGSELWERSLVDPDNRRPVDYVQRRAVLAEIDAGSLPPVDEGGAAKLLVTSRVLRTRRSHPELFESYRGLGAVGPAAAHLVAADRGGAVTLATRLPIGLARRGGWGDTTLVLPPARPHLWRDEFTGAVYDAATPVSVAAVLSRYPVALLVPHRPNTEEGDRA